MANNVITYGTFDTFHYGHLELLKKSKRLGNFLIVAVSTDEFNSVKDKKSYFDFKTRASWVESISCVDLVIPEKSWKQKFSDIKKYDIDILTMGSDWEGRFDNLACDVIYLPRTEVISSSLIKNHLPKGNRL